MSIFQNSHRPAPLTIALHLGVFAVVVLISFRLYPAMYPLRIDLPNHLARHAIQCGGEQGAFYSAYYTFSMRALPNLAADLIYSFDFACQDVFQTNRLITQFSILNFVLALYALHFAIWRKVSLWPLAATLLVYNMPFSYGFENYLLSVPFVFYLFALWLFLAEKPTALRLAIVAPLAFGLYFLHIIAFGFFVLLVAGWELGRMVGLWKAGRFSWKGFWLRLATTLLIAVPAGLHFIFFVKNDAHENGITVFGLKQRAEALTSITMPGGQDTLDMRAILPLAVLVFMAVLLAFGLKTGRLHIKPQMKAALWLVFAVALLAPAVLSGVWFIHIRYPFLVVATLIAASRWRLSQKAQIGLILSLLAIFALRTEALRHEWQAGDKQVQELIEATAKLPAGSGIFLTRAGLSGVIVRHSHTLAYAGIYNDIFMPTLFYGTNPLALSPRNPALFPQQYFPRPIAGLFAFMKGELSGLSAETNAIYRKRLATLPYILVLGIAQPDPSDYPDGVELFHQGSFFTILKSDTTRWGG